MLLFDRIDECLELILFDVNWVLILFLFLFINNICYDLIGYYWALLLYMFDDYLYMIILFWYLFNKD